MTQALKAAAWILLLAIFIVTDGPIDLRPTFGHPNAERFAALAILGFAFVLAYRRRIAVTLVFWLALFADSNICSISSSIDMELSAMP